GKSLELARASGHVLCELEAEAGLGAVLPTERKARREAKKRLEAMVVGLDDAEREAFLAWPSRQAVLAEGGAVEGGIATERLHHLADLMAAVSAESEIEAVMAQALAALVEIAGADRGFLLLYSGFEVTQQIFHGMGEDDSDAFSSSLAYQVLWNGEPLFVEDAQSHAELGMQKSIQALSLRSVLGLPIKEGEETIGVMLADSRRINTQFGEGDMELAMLLARQVGIAITNARRLARYKNGYDELNVLHRLAIATLGAPDLAGMLAPVAVEAAALCGAERLVLLEGEDLACAAAFDAAGRPLAESRDLSQSVSRWVYENGEPLHLLDAQSDESFQAQKSVMALGLRTVFAVPVSHAGTRYGVLYMDNQRVVEADPTALHTLNRIGEMVGAFLSRRPG
ncbi:MAG: GAF domain-containing protein, partial [Candidatus Sericytochromatia bacterium]